MFGWMKPKELSAPAALTLSDLVEPTAMLSALELSVREYLKQTDEGLLVYPAAKRRLNDADGNIRAVWEHTRLEACRYLIMLPRPDIELLIGPARQAEMIDAFLRQKPHEETVVDFNGVPAEDYSLAIGAGLNWLGHCAILTEDGRTRFLGYVDELEAVVRGVQQRSESPSSSRLARQS